MGSNVRALGVVGLVQAVDLALECTVLSEGVERYLGPRVCGLRSLGRGLQGLSFRASGFAELRRLGMTGFRSLSFTSFPNFGFRSDNTFRVSGKSRKNLAGHCGGYLFTPLVYPTIWSYCGTAPEPRAS